MTTAHSFAGLPRTTPFAGTSPVIHLPSRHQGRRDPSRREPTGFRPRPGDPPASCLGHSRSTEREVYGSSQPKKFRSARSTNQSFRRKARSGMELVGQYRERRLDPIGRAGAARDPSSRDLLLSRQASSLALPRSRVPRASDAQRELTGSFPLGELPDHGRGVASSVPKGAWRVADTRGGAHRKPISRRRHGGSGSEVSFIWTGHRGRTVRPGAGAPLRASLPRGLGRLDLRVLDR